MAICSTWNFRELIKSEFSIIHSYKKKKCLEQQYGGVGGSVSISLISLHSMINVLIYLWWIREVWHKKTYIKKPRKMLGWYRYKSKINSYLFLSSISGISGNVWDGFGQIIGGNGNLIGGHIQPPRFTPALIL